MNTGFLGLAVATALTVYGIETVGARAAAMANLHYVAQCLPFTVLKHHFVFSFLLNWNSCNSAYRLRY